MGSAAQLVVMEDEGGSWLVVDMFDFREASQRYADKADAQAALERILKARGCK